METCFGQDIAPSSFVLKIKKEPKDEADEPICQFKSPEPVYHDPRSLVLRFVKDRAGGYSVVPLIKPDPFFEEYFDDLEDPSVKMESTAQGNHADAGKDENFNIKQESPHGNDKLDEAGHVGTEKHENNQRETTKNSARKTYCPSCFYINTKKRVNRHIQRVHLSITKHSCPFCDKKNFKEPISVDCHILKNHRDIDGAIGHIQRTIFECTFCKYRTLKRNNFRRHLTVHGESRLKKQLEKFENKRSRLGLNSKQELKMALSTTKYDCFYCPYTTKDKGSIIKHLRLHREVTRLPFCCKVCKKNFNEKNSLDSHIVKHHIDNIELLQLITNRIYECDLCDYKDVNKNKLIRHKTARHVKKERMGKKRRAWLS